MFYVFSFFSSLTNKKNTTELITLPKQNETTGIHKQTKQTKITSKVIKTS